MTARPLCLLVGYGPGLGDAIARRFAAGGYALGLIARSGARLRAAAESFEVPVAIEAQDAADATGLIAAAARIEAGLGPAEVLIWNAADMTATGPLGTDADTQARALATTYLSARALAEHAAPAMASRGRGAILFTGGGLALEPFPEWTDLAVGKAALRAYALSLYKDVAPRSVSVSVIAVCGIVAPGGPFDPAAIAEEYWRAATAHRGIADREIVIQPPGTDPLYNDPHRRHSATTRLPEHAR